MTNKISLICCHIIQGTKANKILALVPWASQLRKTRPGTLNKAMTNNISPIWCHITQGTKETCLSSLGIMMTSNTLSFAIANMFNFICCRIAIGAKATKCTCLGSLA
jgi:cytochrome c